MTEYRKADLAGRFIVENYFGDWYYFDFTKDDTDRVDFYATAKTHTDITYVGDIKAYVNPKHPRSYDKYNTENEDNGFMLDYDKLEAICNKAKDGRRPILICLFEDYYIVWNLNKCNWESTRQMRWVNKDGQDYGREKEQKEQAYLYKKDAVLVIKNTKVALS